VGTTLGIKVTCVTDVLELDVIDSRTVFVLGAGASNPFGLPLGTGLRRFVLENFNDKHGHAVHLYNTTGFTEQQVEIFISALRFSGLQSVDAFLERRPEFMEIGKATMAIELVLRENHDVLWSEGSNWMLYLYSAMIGNSLEEFDQNEVSVITFNYDRTLEHFLATSLGNSFGKPVEEVAQVMKNIPIIHLHGRLGYLPWENDQNTIPYGHLGITAADMKVFLSEIKVVHEDISDGRDKDFHEAKKLLQEATRVYLLGFGFGTRNVERLGLDAIEPSEYAGTAYGMTPKETAQCKALCGNRPNLNHSFPALEFLRNMATLS
jgi:hypothetical protein